MTTSKCAVGHIPGGEVTASQWNDRLQQFAKKVHDFNVRGQRQEISHPGFVTEFKFCPHCGKAIDRKALGLMSYADAVDQQNRG